MTIGWSSLTEANDLTTGEKASIELKVAWNSFSLVSELFLPLSTLLTILFFLDFNFVQSKELWVLFLWYLHHFLGFLSLFSCEVTSYLCLTPWVLRCSEVVNVAMLSLTVEFSELSEKFWFSELLLPPVTNVWEFS